MYPAEPIAASNASKIMLFILSFRCSKGDGHSQWPSPFSFAGLQGMRRAKLICESPSSAKRIPDDLATILKRVSPFKELANKAATFRQARYRAVRRSVAGMDIRISFSISRTNATSSASHSEMAMPSAPARAVRPIL